jgi:ubiquinone/menaquinone biosynthesis C-methylase UbiE
LTDASQWIERYYDRESESEWKRLERHRTEFAVTQRALRDHLPPPPAKVLDCGGGPGRYAIELARRGYAVTLFDLSATNLCLAKRNVQSVGVQLAGFEHGMATDLSRFADRTFDAVLLMGPLYHLLDAGERRQALSEAQRVLRPGGPLFAAFITRYAAFRYCVVHDTEWPVNEPEFAESLLQTGILPPRGEGNAAFVAYCAHPTEVTPLLQDVGLDVTALLGVEGLVSMIEDGVNALSGPAWQTWVDLNYRIAADPSVHGGVEHLLAVGVKPRWRAVLCEISRQLDEAGIRYKVVGGTVPALYGVDAPVNDIDLETDAEGAYRFQELLAHSQARAVQPVAFCEGEYYRSHLGRFDVDGVMVEVMGDLHRREGPDWTPTAAATEATLELDGVPVSVPWLEEETLAYIRRGRLDRAAQCLPHCDHSRLMLLLRGEQATGVL